MDTMETAQLVKRLAVGFGVLGEEYKKLHGQHLSLERKLATAREQVSYAPFWFFALPHLMNKL